MPPIRSGLLRFLVFGLLAFLIVLPIWPQSDTAVQQALERGKLYESKRQWDLAYEAYREADKLSHHSSAEALLHIALIEKKAGLLPEAAYDAKKAAAAAGNDKAIEIRARLLRAALLTAMANKPTDGKLKDAEAEPRASNVFRSPQSGFSYRYPEGWKPATEDSLRVVNDRLQKDFRSALVKQSAQDSERPQLIAPAYIFYASPRGDGSPERNSLPSLSIRTEPTRLEDVNEKDFRQLMDRMAATTGLKPLATVSTLEVSQHRLARADFERSAGALHYYVSYFQIVSNGSLLHIDVTADSPGQLKMIADTLQSLKFDEAE